MKSVIKNTSDLIKTLANMDITLIAIARDQTERRQFSQAQEAFSALHDICWGEFYRNNIKTYPDQERFVSIHEALTAYRQFIIDTLSNYGLKPDELI